MRHGKRLWILLGVLALAALVLAPTYTTKIYRTSGGDKEVVVNGGEIEVQTGGVMDLQAGSTFNLGGTAVTATAAQLNAIGELSETDAATFTVDADSTAAKIKLDTNAATGDYTVSIVPDNLTGNRTLTLPDATGTLATTLGTETLQNKAIDGDDNTLTDVGVTVTKAITVGTSGVPPVPGIPFTIVGTIGNATETITYQAPCNLRVLDVRGYKTNGNGGAGDTVTIKNAGNAITDAIDLQINDLLVFEAASYDDAQVEVNSGANITIVSNDATDPSCVVQITCVRR